MEWMKDVLNIKRWCRRQMNFFLEIVIFSNLPLEFSFKLTGCADETFSLICRKSLLFFTLSIIGGRIVKHVLHYLKWGDEKQYRLIASWIYFQYSNKLNFLPQLTKLYLVNWVTYHWHYLATHLPNH